jgi:hypothetical protein
VPVPGPGTVDDLLADARKAGYSATRRLVTDWVSLGLLDKPTRHGIGRGKGTTKGVYSANQRQLFLTLLQQQRADGGGVRQLTATPVALWLYWGDTYVSLRQVKRALNTWIGAAEQRNETRSRRAARELIEQLATTDTRRTDRTRLERLLDEANRTGRVSDEAKLQEAIERVLDPNHTGRTHGPPGAQINPEVIVNATVLQSQGFLALAGQRVEDHIFEQARAELQLHLIGYIRDRPQLIKNADASVRHLFTTPLGQQVIPSACTDLIREIGHQLSEETRNDSNT